MASSPFPVSLARLALTVTPLPVLERVVSVVLGKMMARHPRLFDNLARLAPATVHLTPTDTAYRFGLRLGLADPVFYVLTDEAEPAGASVSGTLEHLVDMLEGRADGDTLFFSRDIIVTGDTEIIVGLRNTLDREELQLMDEIIALCGPFARPASLAIGFAGALASRLKGHLESAHNRMHKNMDRAGEA